MSESLASTNQGVAAEDCAAEDVSAEGVRGDSANSDYVGRKGCIGTPGSHVPDMKMVSAESKGDFA